MRETALEYLACPHCSSDLRLHVDAREGDHVMAGSLTCSADGHAFAIRAGVPRFATAVDAVETRTAAAFGWEWTRYRELAERYRQQFLDWLRPVDADFFHGKVVLEAGCGKGRHSALAATFGARAVIAMDLSDAVDAAFANTRDTPSIHVVQADLKMPPTGRAFDFAFSIGVLHHLPVPEAGFHAMVSRLRPGGRISVWVYGRENNGWIVHGITPIRERITSRMPFPLLNLVAGMLTVPLFLITRGLYGPTGGRLLGLRLPYGPYLSYIAPFPFREQHSIVFDHLVAPVAHYLRREEVSAWFADAGLADVHVEHHNANSWRAFGRVPAG